MNVIVLSKPGAEHLCSTWDSCDRLSVISISSSDRGQAAIEETPFVGPVLRLVFDDVDPCGEKVPSDMFPMTDEQAAQVVRFVNRLGAIGTDTLLVHCEGGVSRSAGVAAAIARHLNGDDSQFFGAQFVPNMWCYRLVLSAFDARWDK